MDPRFAPFVIASHWPYLDRVLELERTPARRRALQLLAELQVDAGGDPVRLGRSRLRGLGLSPGEADHVTATLRELASRRVVECLPGRGSSPSAWSFRGDLAHWRGLPWRTSARSASSVVFSCARSRICEGPPAFVRDSPGQGLRGSPAILLGSAAHLYRSGETLVDITSSRGASRANAAFRAWGPVDIQRKTSPSTPLSPFSESSIEDSLYLESEERQQILSVLQGAFRASGGDVIFPRSKRWAELLELVGELNLDQARAIAAELGALNARRDPRLRLQAPLLLTKARELTRAPLVLALADRPDLEP
jgi:hypothetical protein